MGGRISRFRRSITSHRQRPRLEPPPRTHSTLVSYSGAAPPSIQLESDLRTYEADCLADDTLRSFDSALQARTSRAINSVAVGLDVRSLSLESHTQVIECLLEMNQDVVRIILQNKKGIWKNRELSELVEDYFENSLLTMDFCTALDSCLKRAGHIESIINVALHVFREESSAVCENGSARNYARTLQELENLGKIGDPFNEDFAKVFDSVYARQLAMLQRLQDKNRKIDKKLARMKTYRRISNAIFVAAFAAVLICSVVAAALTAPPVVTALAAAAAVPMGSMGKLLNSLWKKYEKDLTGQKEFVGSMQIGSHIVIKDLENIRAQVQRFKLGVETMLSNAEFAVQEAEAEVVAAAVEEIKKEVASFFKTIHELSDHANKCSRETRMARALILRRIMSNPDGAKHD